MSEPIGVGLIGCGNVAGLRHLPALTGLSDARVVALADPDNGSLESLAARCGVRKLYADHEALLEDPAVEVVGVLTRRVAVGEIETLGRAIAAGVRAATGPVVAYAEEHSFPSPAGQRR